MDNSDSATSTVPENQAHQKAPLTFHNGDNNRSAHTGNASKLEIDEIGNIQNKDDVFKFCKACNIFFNGPQTAKQHYAGKKHRKLEKEPMSVLTCEVCNIILSGEEQAKMHYQGKKHLKKLKQADVKPDDAFVPTRQKVDETSVRAAMEILRSLHFSFKKFKYVKFEVATLEQLIVSKLNTELHCDVCMKKFNGKNPVVDHCNSKKHIQKVMQFKQKLYEAGIRGMEENILPECEERFNGTDADLTGGENGSSSQELLDYDIEFSVQELMLNMLLQLPEIPPAVQPSNENQNSVTTTTPVMANKKKVNENQNSVITTTPVVANEKKVNENQNSVTTTTPVVANEKKVNENSDKRKINTRGSSAQNKRSRRH